VHVMFLPLLYTFATTCIDKDDDDDDHEDGEIFSDTRKR